MTYKEVLENAKKNIGSTCCVCPVCDGLACGNRIPGPGSKAPGNGAHENYLAWQKIRVEMDTILPAMTPDTSTEFLGYQMKMPVLCGPTGKLSNQFNPTDDVCEFNDDVFNACAQCGAIPTFGNGMDGGPILPAMASMEKYGVTSIPVLNPMLNKDLMENIDRFKGKGCVAFAVVVDSAGLPIFRGTDAGLKSIDDLKALKEYAGMPMVVKGVISAKVAEKAVAAGADAIVVSNHGGRVLPYASSSADVLPEIADAVGGKCKIIVDGGIRSGVDVFKAIALGADLVMMFRPVLISWYGGKAEGVKVFLDKIQDELYSTMYMCGAQNLKEITRDKIRYVK